ncbi:MAG: HD domain-containing protein [Lachnospiraceae bacterium]|nr:HD domain-containing protein [Lachnospiraceae bacterium]
MEQLNLLYLKMIDYYRNDPKRIQHFCKVHSFAKLIGELEGISKEMQATLETASLVHDIGIKVSEEKYGNCYGKNQEKEGPAEAEKLLKELEYPDEMIDRVCYLVGHHHTYTDIDGLDYQILVEADFIVNMYEDHEPRKICENVYEKIFRTKAGKTIFRQMFGLD